MKIKLLGQKGEQLAKKHLLNKGYKFLTQNFRTRFGEIDLIFSDRNTIVFVEVKTRSSTSQGLPQEAVTPRKLRTITKLAQTYLLQNQLDHHTARIDVVAIDQTSPTPLIQHLQNVTG